MKIKLFGITLQDLIPFAPFAVIAVGIFILWMNAGTGAAWSGAFGGPVGGAIGFFAATWHDTWRRKQELAALKASIYAEICDRAARCVNDYIKPWRDLKIKDAKTSQLREIEKFSPADPVVFPAVAAKLGLLEPKVLFAVTQFYFRLAALSQAIQYVHNVRPTEVPWSKDNDEAHAKLITTRRAAVLGQRWRPLKD